jgi:hypothetical protein
VWVVDLKINQLDHFSFLDLVHYLTFFLTFAPVIPTDPFDPAQDKRRESGIPEVDYEK